MTEKDKLMHKVIIPGHLDEIESEYNVKILLAVESGSRAWGFASPDSDWDVRFIYIHRPEWYLHIEERRDVIERMYDDDVDLAGWDLKKALFLFKGSNPSMLEWLHSPIIYRQDKDFMKDILALEPLYSDIMKVMQKYRGMYISHNEHYLHKDGYTLKRFLYYLRGVLACRWIERYRSLPPVRFIELVEGTVQDKTILSDIEELLRLKSESREHYKRLVDERLVAYAENLSGYYSAFDCTTLNSVETVKEYELLNKLMYNTLMRIWNVGNCQFL